MRGPIVGAFRAWPSPQDCFWSPAAAVYYGYTRTIIRDATPESSVPLAGHGAEQPCRPSQPRRPPTTASAQSTRAPAQPMGDTPTTASPGTGLPAATATQPAAEATQVVGNSV